MKYISILSAVFIFFCSHLIAQPASLDASFANNGIGLYTIPHESATAYSPFLFLQANGKLIVGGTMGNFLGLVRIKTNGSIDIAFGWDGKILSLPLAEYAGYNAATVQADGKFLIVGGTGKDMLVLRYLANGAPDKTI